MFKPLAVFLVRILNYLGTFGRGFALDCCIPSRYPTPNPFPSFRQVQQRVPQPEHGSEATGADAAGLQAPAVQSGEIRGEGEDRPRPRQAAPGTETLADPKSPRSHRGKTREELLLPAFDIRAVKGNVLGCSFGAVKLPREGRSMGER